MYDLMQRKDHLNITNINIQMAIFMTGYPLSTLLGCI